jgi:hypothetical protein
MVVEIFTFLFSNRLEPPPARSKFATPFNFWRSRSKSVERREQQV